MRNELIVLVIMDVLDFTNTCRKENTTTDNARIVCDVGGASEGRYPALRAIGDCILFRMHGCLLVSVSYDRYMFTSRKEPIISLAYNAIGMDKDATHMEPFTRASLGSHLDNFLKILVPRRSHSDNTS